MKRTGQNVYCNLPAIKAYLKEHLLPPWHVDEYDGFRFEVSEAENGRKEETVEMRAVDVVSMFLEIEYLRKELHLAKEMEGRGE